MQECVCVHSESGKGVETLLISQIWPLVNEEGEQEGGRWLYCWRDHCRITQPEHTTEYLRITVQENNNKDFPSGLVTLNTCERTHLLNIFFKLWQLSWWYYHLTSFWGVAPHDFSNLTGLILSVHLIFIWYLIRLNDLDTVIKVLIWYHFVFLFFPPACWSHHMTLIRWTKVFQILMKHIQ